MSGSKTTDIKAMSAKVLDALGATVAGVTTIAARNLGAAGPNHVVATNLGVQQSIRLHLIIGLSVVVLLAGGLGGWASTQQISGALIAPGQIVVESNVKKVQHPTGGVVG